MIFSDSFQFTLSFEVGGKENNIFFLCVQQRHRRNHRPQRLCHARSSYPQTNTEFKQKKKITTSKEESLFVTYRGAAEAKSRCMCWFVCWVKVAVIQIKTFVVVIFLFYEKKLL